MNTLPPVIRVALWMCLTAVGFAVMIGSVRELSAHLDVFVISFWRNLAAVLLFLPWIARMGRSGAEDGAVGPVLAAGGDHARVVCRNVLRCHSTAIVRSDGVIVHNAAICDTACVGGFGGTIWVAAWGCRRGWILRRADHDQARRRSIEPRRAGRAPGGDYICWRCHHRQEAFGDRKSGADYAVFIPAAITACRCFRPCISGNGLPAMTGFGS